ncbi:MAG: spermidine/putrescine ABC transporter substrate-binding protein [Bryobacteraceae bacterium]|jgi:spermidine/putrescine transport system substrate-binding protein
MNRRVFLTGAFSVACGRGLPRLNVYNWSDYVAPDTVSNFEHEFGVNVRYGTYEGNQEMIAKVMSGNSGWDVVFPSADMIQPMREMGLLQPLNHAWLPNLDSLDRAFQTPPWDQELRWSVPYMHGTTGVVYQKSLAAAPEAWADMWSERLRGKITMLDDPQEVIGICLKKIGFSVNSGDPQELRAAQAQAVAQKPLLRAYLNAEVRDQLVAGDVTAAQAWAVTAGQAIAAAPDKLAFSLPKEGFRGTRTPWRSCAKAAGVNWRTASLTTCFARWWPPRSFVRRRPRPRTRLPGIFCPRNCGRIPFYTRRRKFWRGVSGSNQSRLRRNAYGIVCGPKSKAPKDTNC